MLHYMCRSMLQVDPRRRPRVEELEALPALQPAMTSAKAIHTDFKQQQVPLPVDVGCICSASSMYMYW